MEFGLEAKRFLYKRGFPSAFIQNRNDRIISIRM